MSVTPPVTYPGVYVQEVPSGVRTITGVATSITAFIDYFKKGLLNKPIQILSMADFERELGGLDDKSEASYAIQQFFLNGGTEAWAIRVASGNYAASAVDIFDGIGGGAALALSIEAGRMNMKNPGQWGNHLRVNVDYLTPSSNKQFNMSLLLFEDRSGEEVLVSSEVFRALSMDKASSNFVETVVNDEFTGSRLVHIISTGNNAPCQTGTVSGVLPIPPTKLQITSPNPEIAVTIGNSGPYPVKLGGVPTYLPEARAKLETAIRAAHARETRFSQATVSIVDAQLRILAGPGAAAGDLIKFAATANDATTAGELKLDNATSKANVQSYTLGQAAPVAGTAQDKGTVGGDGDPPDGPSLIGDPNTKMGIYALEGVDLFNILCIPRTAIVKHVDPPAPPALSQDEAAAVIAVANTYCEKHRAFFLIDTPDNVNDAQTMRDWIETPPVASPRDKNAAIHFPRVQIPDPLNSLRPRNVGACGTIAGLFARTDANRGVWKAPAGTEATLTNVQRLDYSLNDGENGVLNPLAVNCLRNFPIYGIVCWGARTLDGSDQAASEWKYIQVRRTALFIEETLFRGLKWVVFESNAEPLWAQIRLNVGAFMRGLFRQGAFQGTTPREAYFVKCDSETTTQDDINHGIVNILVGFAPLKPAEFVIIRIQQMAGQIQT